MQQNKIYVGNFPYTVDESQLREIFAPYGDIEEIAASYNPAVINIFSGIVGWIIRTIFDGVTVNIDLLSKIKPLQVRN